MGEVRIPVPNVPIVGNQHVSRAWRWFFHEILQQLGGGGETTVLFTSDIGDTVQAWDAQLDAIAALSPTNGLFIVGDGSTFVGESGATALVSLGAQADLDVVSQADAEAGTATDERIWTAQRVSQAIAALETTDVVLDTTPQLGGNLDVNGNSIVSASDGDIPITPNGTGDIILDGQKWPQADGTNSQILETDGSGQTSWVNAPAGSGDALPVVDTKNVVKGSADATKQVRIEADTNITTGTTRVITMADQDIDLTPDTGSFLANVVTDTTPQLGGDLDLNGKNIDFPTTANVSDCLDEDDMSSDSATVVATQQSIKAYVDASVAGAFRGALVNKSADETGADYSGFTPVPWTAEEYDTDSLHDNVTNNTRLTTASGTSRVELNFNLEIGSHTANQFVRALITKNGVLALFPGAAARTIETGLTSVWLGGTTAVIDIVGGTDYFEVQLDTEADTSITVAAAGSWFSMKIIE